MAKAPNGAAAAGEEEIEEGEFAPSADRGGGENGRRSRHRDKKSRKRKEQSASSESGGDSGGSDDDRDRSKGKKRRRSHRRSRRGRRGRGRRSGSDSDEDSSSSYDSYSDSGTEESDSDSETKSGSQDKSEEARRRRKEKRRRREREYEKERRRRRKEKERRRKKEKEEERRRKKKKEEKKKKEKEAGKKGAVTNSWGKFGIIKEIDMWNKRPEFNAWLLEVKQVNLETLPNWEEKQMFKEFMEDYNTATLPSKKYYDLDAYHRHQLEKEIKKGLKKTQQTERTVFNDEEQRRMELQIAREKQKEEEVEALKRSMQSGMAQAMKEQARLREEMMYQYKIGNLEAAAAIQKRLEPDPAT